MTEASWVSQEGSFRKTSANLTGGRDSSDGL